MDSDWKIDRQTAGERATHKVFAKPYEQSGGKTTWETGLYIHIPFCEKKCPYCDFNTYAGLESLYDDTVEALCQELRQWSETLQKRQIRTIFLGGGTPSALSLHQLSRIFTTIQQHYRISNSCEITSEVNPGAVDREKFIGLKTLGVNRLSLGVQSFQESELRFLGRIHDVDDVYAAYKSARAAGFENINLDFIFGLPEQSDATWRDTLRKAIELSPDHLSLYSLIVEPNTVLNHWVQTGQVPAPNDDEAAHHYESAMTLMSQAGYTHYEVSNWSRTPELACAHNLIYWRNDDYLGIGPGAHSHIRLDNSANLCEGTNARSASEAQRANPQLSDMLMEVALALSPRDEVEQAYLELRWGNRKSVPGYINRLQQFNATGEFVERPTSPVAMGETMMLGLRLIDEGVSYRRFGALHGSDLRQVYAPQLESFVEHRLLKLDGDRVRLTSKGLMVGNQIFQQFLV